MKNYLPSNETHHLLFSAKNLEEAEARRKIFEQTLVGLNRLQISFLVNAMALSLSSLRISGGTAREEDTNPILLSCLSVPLMMQERATIHQGRRKGLGTMYGMQQPQEREQDPRKKGKRHMQALPPFSQLLLLPSPSLF
jgi:hypothetical protein